MLAMTSTTSHWVALFYLFVVFPAWLTLMGAFLYFFIHVGPSALKCWAEREGLRIVELGKPSFRDWTALVRHKLGKRFYGRAYRVVVEDKAGHMREGLVLVGGARAWPSVSVKRCPVEVRWDDAQNLSKPDSRPKNKHPLWDSDLAAQSPVSRWYSTE